MNEKIVCPYCNASFRSPATYAAHSKTCVKQPVSTMLTRKLADKMAKRRRKGFMIDLSNQGGAHGTFPQPASESVEERMEAIKQQVRELNEIRLKRMPNIVAAVRSALNSHRARRKLYNKFGVQMN